MSVEGTGKLARHTMSPTDETDAKIVPFKPHAGLNNLDALYEQVIDLVLKGRVADDDPQAPMLYDVLGGIARSVDEATRIQISQAIAKTKKPPMALAERFAHDSISVATPVLRNAPFSEKALIRIVKRTPRTHHLVLAERSDLSQKVWKALAETPDPANIIMGHRAEEEPHTEAPAAAPASTNTSQRRNVDLDDEELWFKFASDEQQKTAPAQSPARPARSAETAPPKPFLPPQQHQPYTPAPTPSARHEDMAPVASPSAPLNAPASSSGPLNAPAASSGPLNEWTWATDRSGTIIDMSDGSSRAFGRPPETLLGSPFFAMLEAEWVDDQNPLAEALQLHHPIRQLAVLVQDPFGTSTRWELSARARFDPTKGRFLGYSGNATSLPMKESAEATSTSKDTPLELLLLDRLTREATDHVRAALSAASHLAAIPGVRDNENARATFHDLVGNCFRIRDVMDDAREMTSASSGSDRIKMEGVRLNDVLAVAIEEDTVRHGIDNPFRLAPNAADVSVQFNAILLRRLVTRMMELGREYNHLPTVATISTTKTMDGNIRISIPLVAEHKQMLMTGDVLYQPGSQLRRHENAGDPNMHLLTPSMGLSIAQNLLHRLGGNLALEQEVQNGQVIALYLPNG